MSFVSASQPAPAKQNRPYFGLRGSPVTPSANLRSGTRPFSSQRPARAENHDLGTAYMPKVAECLLLPDFCCFPPASPALAPGTGKQKAAQQDRSKHLIFLKKSGAGEGIRTLDPNLGNREIVMSRDFAAVRSNTRGYAPGRGRRPLDGNLRHGL